MAIQRISFTTPTFKAQQPTPPEQPTPQQRCETCRRWYNKQCSFFDRPTQGDYNRCMEHTTFNPNLNAVYKPPTESLLNKWIEESEKAEKDREKKVKLPC